MADEFRARASRSLLFCPSQHFDTFKTILILTLGEKSSNTFFRVWLFLLIPGQNTLTKINMREKVGLCGSLSMVQNLKRMGHHSPEQSNELILPC